MGNKPNRKRPSVNDMKVIEQRYGPYRYAIDLVLDTLKAIAGVTALGVGLGTALLMLLGLR